MTDGDTDDGMNPVTLGALDPAEFVGEPPAGDDDPTDFSSNDQSADRTGSSHGTTSHGTSDDSGHHEDAPTEEDA